MVNKWPLKSDKGRHTMWDLEFTRTDRAMLHTPPPPNVSMSVAALTAKPFAWMLISARMGLKVKVVGQSSRSMLKIAQRSKLSEKLVQGQEGQGH